MNAYRVLLTRGRDATVVFVPPMPALDPVWDLLMEGGFRELHGHGPYGLGADVPRPDLKEPPELPDLIERARNASNLDRIELRDPIAHFGTQALEPLVALANDGYGPFAVLTIKKVGELGSRYEAAEALRSINRDGLAPSALRPRRRPRKP